MAPIRIGIIGLSSTATTAWASSAHLPYLLSPRGRAKYTITALCNSSVEAAQRAVKAYNLPSSTKAYGSPADLAADPDVDLVVVSTRVDQHYDSALSSVEAGKSVYVEWPLAQDAKRAGELADAARRSGARTVVGVQGRFAPSLLKVKEILEQGRIGKVLSSEVRAAGGSLDRDVLPAGLKYFTQREVGGNVITIGFGHLFDQVQHVLGEATIQHSHTQIQRPDVKIRDPSTKQITETVSSNVPDLLVATATLPPSNLVSAQGATLLARFRRGQPFGGEPQLSWTVNGEKGEIRLTSQNSVALQAFADVDGVKIEVHDFKSGEVESVPWAWEEGWQAGLPVPARCVGAVYEAFAEGESLPSFEDAVRRHEQVDGILYKSGISPNLTSVITMNTSPIYFWRETGHEGYLSQWWTSNPFTESPSPSSSSSPSPSSSSTSSTPITYRTAEHYMMHAKALLFTDPTVALSILKADHPRKVKALGRKVRNFNEALWNENRERIVREGNILKFRSAPELRKKLLATGDRELVEASPMDRIWGIGFSPDKAPGSDRGRWGLNLLGKILMEVRTVLREEAEVEEERKGRKREVVEAEAKRRRSSEEREGSQVVDEGAVKKLRRGEEDAGSVKTANDTAKGG
ncbi:oxidoreductase family protein [Colletotrichum cuscutae]|uniref:Oxidoreductase family protein n=1 Tax=Colletotrichum cuscutae TaxID=1209917 RepID=A0AAI9YCE5_9PEZI|nr:oxidoreductase family protein [Colletotrichum cuscutae]